MPYKPLPENEYIKYLKRLGWSLKKGSIDWNLNDEKSHFLCTIKIAHGKRTKSEVVAHSVKKTEKLCKERGLKWPPSKK